MEITGDCDICYGRSCHSRDPRKLHVSKEESTADEASANSTRWKRKWRPSHEELNAEPER